MRVYLGLGSNLADPQGQLKAAQASLEALPQSHWVAISSLYVSKPMGPQDQPDYTNAVACLDTQLTPLALLQHTQRIEQQQGRVRKADRWGPRTLDIDILLFGDLILELAELQVPHYGMKERSFVLYPLAELAPDIVHPDGTPLRTLLEQVPMDDLRRL